MTRATTLDRETFRALTTTALGDRARNLLDPEGWPKASGRYGRLEWRGVEVAGAPRVYVFTDRAKMIAMRAVPGARPAQIGDQEAAFWVAADDVGAIKAFGALLQTRTRRSPDAARHLAGTAYRSTSDPVSPMRPTPAGGS